MNPTEVAKILDILVERLGPVGQQVWDALLRQVLIQAQVQQTWGIGLCILAGVLLVIAIGTAIYEFSGCRDFGNVVAWAALAAISGLAGATYLSWAYKGFTNPTYYAIQLLLGR